MDRNKFLRGTSAGLIIAALILVVLIILVNTTSLGDTKALKVLFGVSALNFTLRASVPLVLGALCGILCERTGIINIGIEGMMLAGAFAAFVAKVATNGWPLGASLAFGVAAALADWRAHGACCTPPCPFAIAWTRLFLVR